MTLIRELIDIPERVHRDDFVLRLAEGVARPDETLRTYVVTPQLADAFDRALGLIRDALASGSSKAAYLHGSFGSGKSHFMAVLHLLLQQDAAARAAEGLEGVVTRHDDWLAGRRFLLVPYHMIGQASMEAAVLGGYAARVAELHPDAPVPGVYRSEGLFADARRLRAELGDEAFFRRLNAGRVGGRRGSLRVGRSVRALGGAGLRGRARRAGGRRGAQPPGRRAGRFVLPELRRRGAGQRRGVRAARRGAGDRLAPRARPGLRRAGAVSRRADPVARHPRRRSQVPQRRRSQGVEARRGAGGRPAHPHRQLRGAPARPA